MDLVFPELYERDGTNLDWVRLGKDTLGKE
jgi:hypothetical protein